LEREQVEERSSHYERSDCRNCKNGTEILVPAFINVQYWPLRAEAECAFMQPDAKCILEIAVSRAQGTKNLPATQGSVIIMPSCPLIG
jgi:hypothetical protein